MLAVIQGTGPTVVSIVGLIGTMVVGLAGLYVGYIYNKRLLNEKKHEEERKEIYKKLNSFYGPALSL